MRLFTPFFVVALIGASTSFATAGNSQVIEAGAKKSIPTEMSEQKENNKDKGKKDKKNPKPKPKPHSIKEGFTCDTFVIEIELNGDTYTSQEETNVEVVITSYMSFDDEIIADGRRYRGIDFEVTSGEIECTAYPHTKKSAAKG